MREPQVHPPPSAAPDERLRPIEWVRRNLLFPWWNAVLTVVTLAIVAQAGSALWDWGVRDAAFGRTPESCAGIDGACWSFVGDTFGLFMVGTYPQDERWRPLACALALFVLAVVSLAARGRLQGRKWLLVGLWFVYTPLALALLHGGQWLGLTVVPTFQWGGLMLTIILSVTGIAFAFPLGVLLALGRRSRRMPAVRALCVGFIELIRGVPLISILFLTSVLVPLFLPSGVEVDAVVRAQVGIILFQAGYLAEVVRGGFQAVPPGQEEAARSLGLGYAQVMWLVVLPQALRVTIPPLTNQVIITLKDTTLVAVVGLFDLIGIAEVALRNPKWLGMNFEAYAVVGFFYWVMCFSISRVSLWLEERLEEQRA